MTLLCLLATPTLCDQFCGTYVHWFNGVLYNDRDNKRHICPVAERANEVQVKFNTIKIKFVRPKLDDTKTKADALENSINELSKTLAWQERENRPLAEKFDKRKEAGKRRN